jgi:hypothetical protein
MEKWFIVLILAAFAPSAPAQAAGPTNSIQYNAGGGTFGGSSALTFVPGTLTLAPTLYSSSIEGYNFADQNSGGLTSAGIFSTAVCTTLGCFVVAPPTWSSGTYFSSYAVDGNSPFYNFVGTSRSILKDDRGMASAVLFRDPVQPTAASAHFAYTHACLFSTPYETAGAQYNGGGSCFQLSMAGANSGYSHGNPLFLTTPVPVLPGTGWSHGNAIGVHYTNFTPGVHQGMSMSYYNQAVGDTAGAYYYVQTNGGVTAASDEGFKALAGDSGENPSQYYGTVNSPGGTGLTQISTLPAVGPGGTASSDASQGDGSYLIDTAGAPYPPTLSPYNMTGLVQLGGQTPDEMTVGGTGTVTASTAIGTLAAALAPNYCVPVGNCTQLMTFTVSLMSGAFQMTYPSTNIICFADGFHEQAVVTMRSVPIGGVQSVTAVIREPHPAGTWVFQGGSSCQFGSFDANINTGPGGQGTRNTLRYLFEVFGAPDTTHLYVGSFSYGGLASLPLGNVSRATGNTTFNIFPGAEVLDVQDYSMADAITAPQVDGTFTLEPNNVVWSAVSPPDTVEEPHNPVGAYCGICWSLIINSPQAVKSVGYKFSVGGQGAQGGHYDNAAGFDAVKVPNTTLNTFYVGNGGLAAPPGGIRLTGGGTGPSGLFA